MPAAGHEKSYRRRGRPPASQAGQFDERILQVATSLFLDRGFGRTTLDLVAQHAEVGKSSLYARYPSKGDLFAAVVTRSIQTMFDHLAPVPEGLKLGQRLQAVGEALIEGMLHPRCVAFMRITAAEADNFPDLALTAYRVSFDGAVFYVLKGLGAANLNAADPRLITLAQRFVEVVVQPLSFQAAFGVDAALLRLRASQCVHDAVELLQERFAMTNWEQPRT
ncbi:TetR/AcrR family transcriptional regulator [Limnohabitans curvus]|uniref:TetR/AcrR family transcriptional regulator n=1 Tax=Limnohabitans curvus TaxID=323423 RepID=UPI001B865B88|nr:TetR/AcrR family transcriptional regulator [Limnohabitans curvus]